MYRFFSNILIICMMAFMIVSNFGCAGLDSEESNPVSENVASQPGQEEDEEVTKSESLSAGARSTSSSSNLNSGNSDDSEEPESKNTVDNAEDDTVVSKSKKNRKDRKNSEVVAKNKESAATESSSEPQTFDKKDETSVDSSEQASVSSMAESFFGESVSSVSDTTVNEVLKSKSVSGRKLNQSEMKQYIAEKRARHEQARQRASEAGVEVVW